MIVILIDSIILQEAWLTQVNVVLLPADSQLQACVSHHSADHADACVHHLCPVHRTIHNSGHTLHNQISLCDVLSMVGSLAFVPKQRKQTLNKIHLTNLDEKTTTVSVSRVSLDVRNLEFESKQPTCSDQGSIFEQPKHIRDNIFVNLGLMRPINSWHGQLSSEF